MTTKDNKYKPKWGTEQLQWLPFLIKPPIGIMPKHLWQESRMLALSCAIKRYIEEKKKIPPEWVEEYNELRHVQDGND